jgi:hypothetical protein
MINNVYIYTKLLIPYKKQLVYVFSIFQDKLCGQPLEKKDSLILQSEETFKLTKCKIVTSTRYNNDEEKHLTTGWYTFIHQNNINAGDKLVFTFDQSQTIMRVKIERRVNT